MDEDPLHMQRDLVPNATAALSASEEIALALTQPHSNTPVRAGTKANLGIQPIFRIISADYPALTRRSKIELLSNT